MGVGNGIFWSEIGSGFGDAGGTPPPKIPRSNPPRGRVKSQDSVNTGTSQTVNRAHLMTGVRLLITVCTCSRA